MIGLQFVATPAFSSNLIKVFERGWCSHVDAILPDGSLLGARSDAVGGKPPGVQIRPANYEKWSTVQQLWFTTDVNEDHNWLAFLTSQIGKPYDKLAILAFAMNRDWRAHDHWFCSELQAAALEACRFFPNPLSDVVNRVTPRDLLLLTSPWRNLYGHQG